MSHSFRELGSCDLRVRARSNTGPIDGQNNINVLNRPIECNFWDTAQILLKESKSIGLSECSAETLRRAYKVHPIAAVQGKYKSIDDFEPDDVRRTIPRFQGENFIKNLELAHKFEEYAITPDNIVAIPGKHLEENFDAIKVNLNSDELTEIRKFINSKIIGDRYSSDILDMVGLNKYEVTITVNLRFTVCPLRSSL
ncbi:hypothetical protein RhiirC2_773991 [Rhizophagus irregularis]|uniref:Uncharacterized protein n=1 Tax=Rhizophagus irregularis TaxID=588596 RepID=A0A2N1NMQ0_9GLOM|nr:hypothetical protein RhiirC2_773991 [Rhizophagus irregularis]